MTKLRNKAQSRGAQVAVAVLAVSFLAHAEEAAPVAEPVPAVVAAEVVQAAPEKTPLPFHGSSLSYSHSASVFTLAPGAEPFYNPNWGHRLGLFPEWHFNDQFFARGRFFISQELTLSDSTAHTREFELSDLWLDAGLTGWKEPVTGLKLGGSLRVGLPTSRVSQAQTRVATVGPGVSLTRTFDLLGGLSLSYGARFTYRFHRSTTGLNAGPSVQGCGVASSEACAEFLSTGVRNAPFDITHGLDVSFSPISVVTVAASFSLVHVWLYPLSTLPKELQSAQGIAQVLGTDTRNASSFNLSVSWQAFKPVGFTLGAFTYSSQLGPDGRFIFPLFNRNTSLYLEAAVDIEAAVSSFL